MFKIQFVVGVALVASACAATETTGDDGAAVTSGDAEQQLATGGGKGDAAGKSTDPRLVNCHLEYQAVQPAFVTRASADFENTFGKIENDSVLVGDGSYTLLVATNPHPPYNLSFIAQLYDAKTNKSLSYVVLPRPHVGGAFLFELGAAIPPVTFADTGEQSFDSLRAYCSIRMP